MGATAGILGAVGAVGDAAAQRAQANALTRRADFQASMADIQATDVLARGDEQANARELAGRRAQGAQRAAAAASGIDPNTGTTAALQGDEAKYSALDAQIIRNNAAREAWGLKTDAAFGQMGAKAEAAQLRAQAGVTLLTGAAKTYGLYARKNDSTVKTRKGGGVPPLTSGFSGEAHGTPWENG